MARLRDILGDGRRIVYNVMVFLHDMVIML
jgi:hypothetical protein